MTLYPPWSTDTNDIDDNNQVASDRNRKELQDEIHKDTPVKTEINKPYIDNIDAYCYRSQGCLRCNGILIISKA